MIQVQTGQSFDAVLEGAPTGLEGTLAVRVVDPTTETTVVTRTTTGINEYPAGSGVYGVTLTAPALGANSSPWPVSVLWDTGLPLTPDGVFTEDLVIYSGPVASDVVGTFATAADVATRLGRDLTAEQEATANEVIAIVEAQIIDEVDRDQAWADSLSPVPKILKALCVSKAIGAVNRPDTAVASETLGAYSVTFTRSSDSDTSAGDLWLTDQEKRLVRMTVYGTLTGSSTPRALHDRLIDLYESRDVDELEE